MFSSTVRLMNTEGTWNFLPILAGVTNPNSAGDSDYVAVGFFFGDPSSSHSEKYCLVVSPRSGSGFGVMPDVQTFLNDRYGVCDMKLVFLKKGWKYDVTLSHAATNIAPSSDRDPDYALIAQAYGIGYLKLDNSLKTDSTLAAFLAEDKSMILEVDVDRDELC